MGNYAPVYSVFHKRIELQLSTMSVSVNQSDPTYSVKIVV